MKGSKKKMLLLTLISVLMLSTVLAGCGSKNSSGKQSDLKVGLVTDLGSVNDKSFNQSAWEGLQQLEKDTGIKVKYVEPKKDSELVPSLNKFVKDKYDLTWATGMTMMDPVAEVSAQNPDSKMAIVDAEVKGPNVASILFQEHEGSFLVGVIAGSMTKTNTIGFVGGMELPVIKRFEAGFKAGVQAVNPNAKVDAIYVGDFNSVDKGKNAANTLYNKKADIVFHAAGQAGNGVFTEAKERKKNGEDVWVIGVDMDQSLTHGDDITLTSMVKRVDEAVLQVSKMMQDGKFPGGQTLYFGLKEKGVDIAPTSSKNVPEDVLKKVEEYREKIISGEIKVPTE
ncbi:BMP family lipoprotein [Paenibacillus marinisediminis]